MKYRLKSIQTLRGFAAVAVFLFHLQGETLAKYNGSLLDFSLGYLGVDFFFVLSGFIITLVHSKDVGFPSKVRPFLKKRFIRIFPFYWIVLLVSFIIQLPDFPGKPTLNAALDLQSLEGWVNLLKTIFLLPMHLEAMIVGVSWTLTYELVFYIFFAIGIFGGWKTVKFLLPIWVIFIMIYSRDLLPKTQFFQHIGGSLIVEFLLGCLAAYTFTKYEKPITFKLFAAQIILISLLFLAYLSWHPFNRDSIAITMLIGLSGASIILYSASLEKFNGPSWLSAPILVLIGDASYSLYLTHSMYTGQICDLFASAFDVRELPDWQKYIVIICVVALCILVGIIIHLAIEKPVLQWLNKKTKINQLNIVPPHHS